MELDVLSSSTWYNSFLFDPPNLRIMFYPAIRQTLPINFISNLIYRFNTSSKSFGLYFCGFKFGYHMLAKIWEDNKKICQSENHCHLKIREDIKKTTTTTTTTTTKPFVPSIWGRLHEPKENYAGSGTWISFLHSFLSSNCLHYDL